MLRLVLDTNVVLDLFHFADAAVTPIREALTAGRVACFADDSTLDELTRVVTYPEFRLSAEAGSSLVAGYRQQVTVVVADGAELPPQPRCKDRDDQKFLELSARAGADILVTKDKALLALRRRPSLAYRIMTPAEAGLAINSRP